MSHLIEEKDEEVRSQDECIEAANHQIQNMSRIQA
jgi:hypothetical protein